MGDVGLFENRADISGQGHFGHRHQDAAVGHVVAGCDLIVADQLTHQFARAAFAVQGHGRRRSVLALADFA